MSKEKQHDFDGGTNKCIKCGMEYRVYLSNSLKHQTCPGVFVQNAVKDADQTQTEKLSEAPKSDGGV